MDLREWKKLKEEDYPHTLDACIDYMDHLALEGIAGEVNPRIGGMCLCVSGFLEELKTLRMQGKAHWRDALEKPERLLSLLWDTREAMQDAIECEDGLDGGAACELITRLTAWIGKVEELELAPLPSPEKPEAEGAV